MAKRYLLINPPRYEVWPEYFYEEAALIQKWSIGILPAALLRIGTYLRDNGHEVSMINCGGVHFHKPLPKFLIGKRRAGNFNDKEAYSNLYHLGMSFEEFRKRLLLQETPDEILVTSFFTYQWECTHEIIKICKEVFPASKVSLGGIYPTLCPDHARTSRADAIQQGEWHETNECRQALDLLDEVPDYMILKSTRGCPAHCSYCAVHILEGNKMSYRQPEDVVDEIEENIWKYDIRTIVMWESSILTNSKNHFERLLDIIIERKLNLDLRFPEGFSPFGLKEDLLYKMKQAGLFNMAISLETSNKEMAINRFNSCAKLSGFQAAMKLVKKVGIFAVAFVLAGMPDQEVEDVKRTVLDALYSGGFVSLMPFTPIPGTKEYTTYHKEFAHKGLEELHPMLWPCVKSRSDYDKLCHLHEQCIRATKQFVNQTNT